MKIIFCLNHYLPHQVAGTELYVHALAKALQEKGKDVMVVIPAFGSLSNEVYYHDGIKVESYAEPSVKDRLLLQGRRKPDGLINFIEILKREKPSIVHLHELGGAGYGLFHLAEIRQLGISIATTLHIAGYTCSTGQLMYMGKELCDGRINLRKCTVCSLKFNGMSPLKSSFVQSVSSVLFSLGINSLKWNSKIGTVLGQYFAMENLKKRLSGIAQHSKYLFTVANWYKNMLELNGISHQNLAFVKQGIPTAYTGVSINRPIESDSLCLVFVGRITRAKGLHLLLSAIKHISNPSVSIDIYGQEIDANYVSYCRSIIESSSVRWKGLLNPTELITTLTRYDALVLPSIICEMSPLVIQEAFAAGIPVIASNVYGNSEQIKDGNNGWIFRYGDTKDLQRIIKNLMDNPMKLLEVKRQLPATVGFPIVAEKYLSYYEKILEAK